jgi:hypothetical protein
LITVAPALRTALMLVSARLDCARVMTLLTNDCGARCPAWTVASMAFEAVGLHAMTAQHIELAGDVRSLSGISHTHDARCDAEFTPNPAHESALALIGGTNRRMGGRVSTAQLHECVFEAGACAPRFNGDRRVRRASFLLLAGD